MQVPSLTSVHWGSGVAVSCGAGCRHSLDPTWLWLWCRLAAAAPIQPLTWDSSHAMGEALEKKIRLGKKKKGRELIENFSLGTFLKVQQMDGGDCCTTMSLMPLNYTLKNVIMINFIFCICWYNWKENWIRSSLNTAAASLCNLWYGVSTFSLSLWIFLRIF